VEVSAACLELQGQFGVDFPNEVPVDKGTVVPSGKPINHASTRTSGVGGCELDFASFFDTLYMRI
jgi:hypothetical protein